MNRREKRRLWLRLGAAAAGLAVLGLLAIVCGAFPLSSAEGHWAVTERLIRFTRNRTVAARALWIEAPPLDDAALVLRGAGHYEIGCRPCHGAVADPPPRVLAEMTPRPPPLTERAPAWKPEELFWIVKNGIKTTGMPGWPSQQRDDEVWAMVAFLLRLPELGPEEYRRLARNEEWVPPPAGEPEPLDAARPLAALGGDPPAAVVETCSRCHGEDGRGRGVGAFPRLAGQRREYLLAQLVAFAAGERRSGTMETVAADLDPETLAELAAYYAAQAPGPPAGLSPADVPSTAVSAEIVPQEHEKPGGGPELLAVDAGALARGRAIALAGIPGRRIPACVECHGPGAAGGRPRNPHYPTLAGQFPEYLVLQLELFRAGHRGGSAYSHLMHPIAHRLEEKEMRDVAFWFAAQPAGAAR